MVRSDLQFLHGRALARAIKQVLDGQQRDLAVAYFGKGAMQRLGLTAPHGARILCDFWSGACNPFEIELLMGGGADIRDARGLHAKVYIGSKEAVVASANASANGLGLEGDEVTDRLEAGIRVRDAEAIRSAQSWFDRLFDEAPPICATDIAALKQWWKLRPSPRSAAPVGFEGSLIDLALAHSGQLTGTGFVFTNTENKEADVVKAKKKARILVNQRSREITDWPRNRMFTGWDKRSIRRWPPRFFAFHVGSRGGVSVRALEMEVLSAPDGFVFATADWRNIARPIIGDVTANDIRRADGFKAKAFMDKLKEGRAFSTALEFADCYRELMPQGISGTQKGYRGHDTV
ncbi:MAG: hypothetical protein JWO81_1678 [Alphaproteobacteria bacterium]|nr:hypothetical protein [Alphaproteobacteria bacterium]